MGRDYQDVGGMNGMGHYASNTPQQRKCQEYFGAFGQNRGYMFEEA